MDDFTIIITGVTQEKDLTYAHELVDGLARRLPVIGLFPQKYGITTAAQAPEPKPEPEPRRAAVLSVAFASDRACELAAEWGLTTKSFKGVKPSSASGYTVLDVRAVAKNGR